MRYTRTETVVIRVIIAYTLGAVVVVCGAIYIIHHFIGKWW